MRIFADRFHVGSGTHVGPITVFPVWSEVRTDVNHVASLPRGFEINELENPSVGRLKLNNLTDVDVLIPEGTVLFGGMQTRVLVSDVFANAGVEQDVRVRCVERGRWGGRVDTRAAGRAPVPVVGAIRGLGVSRGTDSRRLRGSQHDVWNRVSRYEGVYGGRQTSSLESIMNLRQTDRLGDESSDEESRIQRNSELVEYVSGELFRLARHTLPGQNGVMVGVSGQPMFLEIFNDEGAFRSQIEEIFKAVALEAPRATGEPTPGRRAVRFAANTMDSPIAYEPNNPTIVSASNNFIDLRSLVALSGKERTLHTSVISARHELVLAA